MILSPVLLFPLLSPSAPPLCPSPLSVVLVLFPDGSSWDLYCYGSPPLSPPSFVWVYQSSSSLSDAFGNLLRASCEPPGNPLRTFWVLLHCICVAITHLRHGLKTWIGWIFEHETCVPSFLAHFPCMLEILCSTFLSRKMQILVRAFLLPKHTRRLRLPERALIVKSRPGADRRTCAEQLKSLLSLSSKASA